MGGGVIWLTILFSGVLAFNRSYQTELENGALETLLLYPGDRRAIFAGKLIANFVFVALVEAVLLPVAAVLYDLPLREAPFRLLFVMTLGTIGFVTLGTFYAAMASRLRAREVLLPLLLFPMLIPLLVGAVAATGSGGWAGTAGSARHRSSIRPRWPSSACIGPRIARSSGEARSRSAACST